MCISLEQCRLAVCKPPSVLSDMHSMSGYCSMACARRVRVSLPSARCPCQLWNTQLHCPCFASCDAVSSCHSHNACLFSTLKPVSTATTSSRLRPCHGSAPVHGCRSACCMLMHVHLMQVSIWQCCLASPGRLLWTLSCALHVPLVLCYACSCHVAVSLRMFRCILVQLAVTPCNPARLFPPCQ